MAIYSYQVLLVDTKFQFHVIFTGHETVWFLFVQPFQSAKPSFFTRVVQKQLLGQICPGDPRLLTLDVDDWGAYVRQGSQRESAHFGGTAVGTETSCGKHGG